MADAAEPNMPVCLISQEGTGEGSSLVIHEEGLAVLRALGTTPVATVAVAGMYRTGKSFFLNQLFPGQSGFVVGNTTTSCTRGIWVWVAPPGVWDSPSGARLLVLDTEGLSSFDQDETYDAKIFSLAILLSSFFVYNSMGVIDESAIDRLFLVGELTKNISLSTVKSRREAEADGEAGGAAEAGGEPAGDGDGDGEGEGEGEEAEVSEADLAQFFPPFLWILRDFSLKLKDGEGRDISLHQYLETALEDRKGSGRRVEDGNRIRQSFRTLFKERECFTLIRPVHEEDQVIPHPRLSAIFSVLLTPVCSEHTAADEALGAARLGAAPRVQGRDGHCARQDPGAGGAEDGVRGDRHRGGAGDAREILRGGDQHRRRA